MIDTEERTMQPVGAALSLKTPQPLAVRRPRWNWVNRNLMIGIGLVVLVFLLAWIGPLFLSYDPIAQDLNVAMQGPTPDHLLGTDQFGRDVLTRILYGLRIDLQFVLSE